MDICSRKSASNAVADEANPTVPEKGPADKGPADKGPADKGPADKGPADKGPADKGLADLLAEAYRLYRAHARPMLLICALLLVPMSLAKSCAVSALLGPKVAADSAGEVVGLARAAEESRQALADAYAHNADADAIARLQRENTRRLDELSGQAARIARDVPGRPMLWLLGLVAALVAALAFAAAVPVVAGALTIAVADRLEGGNAGWMESWMLLLGRLGGLLAAAIPAAGLIAIGLALWVIPGLVVAFCFSLVAPVAVIEGLGGAAALRRSVELVGGDWLRVALLLGVFAALTWAARLLADLVVPGAHIFLAQLLGDLLTIAVIPLPLIAGALLYLDLRRRRDNFSDADLREALAALRR
jgi:hypothetical protein